MLKRSILAISTLAVTTAMAGLTKQAAAEHIHSQFEKLVAKEVLSPLSEEAPKPISQQIAEAKENGNQLQITAKALDLGDDIRMPFAVITRGDTAPENGRALYISMHGGGASPEQAGPHTWSVNSREFQTQIKFAIGMYPEEGIYFIPRMADDRKGRWWHKHNVVAFEKVIDHAIAHWGVNPNRVYLMGVSEGGYGTAILAPYMGDRLAGANAMAAGVGLANPPANLRNVAFRSDVGEKDTMFDRSPLAQDYHKELDRLRELDPQAYVHDINVQPGRSHGIDYSQGIAWISQHTRNPWPEKIVWVNQTFQGIRRDRFYWVAMPEAPETGDIRIDAAADKSTNTITVDVATLDATNTDGNRTHGKAHVAEAARTPMSAAKISLLLNDALLDLDKPITVICNGEEVFNDKVERSAEVIENALEQRPDPTSCPTAVITITTP